MHTSRIVRQSRCNTKYRGLVNRVGEVCGLIEIQKSGSDCLRSDISPATPLRICVSGFLFLLFFLFFIANVSMIFLKLTLASKHALKQLI